MRAKQQREKSLESHLVFKIVENIVQKLFKTIKIF